MYQVESFTDDPLIGNHSFTMEADARHGQPNVECAACRSLNVLEARRKGWRA